MGVNMRQRLGGIAVLCAFALTATWGESAADAASPVAGTDVDGAAGGTICIDLEWVNQPPRPPAAFILADSANRIWQTTRPSMAGGHGTACAADLPIGRYMACEVSGVSFTIVPLPTPGQRGSETCVGLTLDEGETARVAFRNLSPPLPPTEIVLPGLPNTGGGGMATGS